MQSKPTEFETDLVFYGIIPGFARPPGKHTDYLLSDGDVKRLLADREFDTELRIRRVR